MVSGQADFPSQEQAARARERQGGLSSTPYYIQDLQRKMDSLDRKLDKLIDLIRKEE